MLLSYCNNEPVILTVTPYMFQLFDTYKAQYGYYKLIYRKINGK